MTPAQSIALWADELRDISATGLRFSQNIYDREHYQRIQDIALEMLALAADEPLEHMEPLRAPIFSRPTPLSAGQAAIIDEAGQILLIQRADNRRWAMPGGAMAVGETPAQAVTREALEETGVRCAPVALVGVYDNRRYGSASRHHLYNFVFLCRPLDGGHAAEPPSHAIEVLDTAWFAEHKLPEDELLSGGGQRIRDAYRVWRGERCAYFDR